MQPLLQRKSSKYFRFWVCICSLTYPTWNAHVPYCHLWPAWLYNIFQHYLKKWQNFREKILNIRYMFWLFSTTFIWNISRSKKNWTRYDKKFIMVFMQSTCYFCQILMKLEFSWLILEKSLNIKCHRNLSSGSQVVPCRWTDREMDRWMDRHDEANSHFLQFCEHV